MWADQNSHGTLLKRRAIRLKVKSISLGGGSRLFPQTNYAIIVHKDEQMTISMKLCQFHVQEFDKVSTRYLFMAAGNVYKNMYQKSI